MNKTVIMPATLSRNFSVKGFELISASDMELDVTYNLVRGNGITVLAPGGKVIHQNVRGFMPINEEYHLIRDVSGNWWYCTSDGRQKKKSPLCKKNLKLDSLALMFDERGKIRLGQLSIHYPMLSL